MNKNLIIEKLAKARFVERYVSRFATDRELLKELAQEVYLSLLCYSEERIVESEHNGKICFLVFRIAKNMIFSASSPFYYKFLRYEYNRRTIDFYLQEYPEDRE